MSDNRTFFKIKSLSSEIKRPFWSVMIPVYNCKNYFEETLQSVLEQDAGPEQMQIEVIDDCSTEGDVENRIRRIGAGRISYYRQKKNVGLASNWNTCIERAKGHWIHILHQDDIVLPGYYESMRKSIENAPEIGAAFCRYAVIDEDGHWLKLSPIERRTPGILSEWLERISSKQVIQCPAIVVARRTYEKLGGFHKELIFSLDWEMWKRIAASFPVWYEPRILACFRIQKASETSRLIKTGQTIEDTLKSIKISDTYLPKEQKKLLAFNARKYCADFALKNARKLSISGNNIAAFRQALGALKVKAGLKIKLSSYKEIMFIGKQVVMQNCKKWSNKEFNNLNRTSIKMRSKNVELL